MSHQELPQSRLPVGAQTDDCRIVKRYGGRHLVFRTGKNGLAILPRPYILISAFKGPVWLFYGIGQIWLTHAKTENIQGWYVRSPRLGGSELRHLLSAIHPELEAFIGFCNLHGVEGTLVIEKDLLEFHWTFGNCEKQEKQKAEHAHPLDEHFQQLVTVFQQQRLKLNHVDS